MTNHPALTHLKIMLQEVASGQTTIGEVLAALDDSLGRELATPICACCTQVADGPMFLIGSNMAHAKCVQIKLQELLDAS